MSAMPSPDNDSCNGFIYSKEVGGRAIPMGVKVWKCWGSVSVSDPNWSDHTVTVARCNKEQRLVSLRDGDFGAAWLALVQFSYDAACVYCNV